MTGGFGSAVLELIEEARLADPAYRDVAVRIVGIPGGRFVDHGSVADLRRLLRLDAAGLAEQVRETLAALGVAAPTPPSASGPGPRRLTRAAPAGGSPMAERPRTAPGR